MAITRGRSMAALGLTLMAVMASAGSLSGCNIIVPAAYILEGPPTVDAEFTLPDRRTVVFVDDTRNMLPRTALRTRLGDRTATLLLENGLITQAIASSEAIQVVRRFDSESKRISMAQVGEELGAETVIHVKVTSFMLSPDGETPRPLAEAEVRVIDVAGGRRLYPTGDSHRPVVAQLREQPLENYRSSVGRRDMEDQLADQLGRSVAVLFYRHQKKELGERLGVR
ncbi:MAG: hypothetical protein KF724_10410 [Phycisphaeraceae bacterium]|nr:hypothetical protein [Phycisphaeraceae bacterium]